MPLSDDIKKVGYNGLIKNPTLLDLFFDEYARLFEEPCRACPQQLKGYFENYINSIGHMENFELKQGSLISWNTGSGYFDVSQANVNNKLKAKNGKFYPIGAHLFAANKGYSKFFTSVPKDLDNMVNEIKGGSTSSEPTFFDTLVAIKGIGKSTASKLVKDFEDEAALVEGIDTLDELGYKAGAIDALTERYQS